MISFFPECYEDELLFGILARYHMMSSNNSYKWTLLELFGTKSVCSVTDLPSHLQQLCDRIHGNIHTPYELIQRHTLYPYYRPFLPEDRCHLIENAMIGDRGGSVHMLSGIMASKISTPKYLRYCPVCLSLDQDLIGQPIWRRIHQIPGVDLCPMHGIYLQNSNILYAGRFNKQSFEILISNSSQQIDEQGRTNPTQSKFEEFINKQSLSLLFNSYNSRSLENIRSYYLSCLRELGFIKGLNTVNYYELISAFTSYYGKNFLLNLQSNLDIGKEDTWLHKLLRKPRVACHPLRHILLLGFLERSVDDLFCRQIPNNPFGNGPWPCLNKAANHYQEDVVINCDLSFNRDTRHIIGTFACECGFIYTKNESNKERYHGRTKTFGRVWIEALKKLSNEKLSLREMGRRLGTDANTIKNYLEMNDSRSNIKADVIAKNNTEDKTEYYRNKWMDHIQQNKTLSRTELRSSCQAVYTWLYRHDRTWLEGTLPLRKNNLRVDKRVDWNKRDEQISRLINEIIEKLLLESDPPVRITKSRIGKLIKQLPLLEQHLDKLPKCKEILNCRTESVEDFRARRIHLVTDKIRASGEEVQRWRIMRKAGLPPGIDEVIQECILAEMELSSMVWY